MVIKIMASSHSMRSSLEYNENKVSQGDAEIIHTANVDPDLDSFIDTVKRYERRNYSSRELSFHMSVNPSVSDNMTDASMKELISDVMAGLGYAGQPYAVYRHDDIQRRHYHVVSIRTDQRGRKISSRQENRRCLELMSSLSLKYGYRVGESLAESKKVNVSQVERFRLDKGDIMAQMESIIRHCCTYRFTSFEQFSFLLETYGVSLQESSSQQRRMMFRGLDERGKACTAAVSVKDMSIDPARLVSGRVRECSGSRVSTKDLSVICSDCLSQSGSQKHFRAMMAEESVDCRIRRNSEGTISGVVFVDHHTRSVHGLSDLSGMSLSMFSRMEATGQWQRNVQDVRQEPLAGLSTLADILAGLGGGRSLSRDIYGHERKKSKGMKM